MKKILVNLMLTFASLIIGVILFMIIQSFTVPDSKPANLIPSDKAVEDPSLANTLVFAKSIDQATKEEIVQVADIPQTEAASKGEDKSKDKVQPIDEKEEAPKADEVDRGDVSFKRFKINDQVIYLGYAYDEKPHGLGLFIHSSYSSQAGVLMYGEFKDGNTIPNKLMSYSEDFPAQDRFKFNMNNGKVVNTQELGHELTYVNYKKEDGITKVFNDEVLKLSLKETKYIFDGKLKNNLVNGKGKLYYNMDQDIHLLIYKGEFDDGYADGKGTEYNAMGTVVYEGDYKDGKYHGDGIKYYDSGSKLFEGRWKDGSIYKKGIAYYENGNIQYDGEYDYDLLTGTDKEGSGKLYFENGQLEYDGDWKNGDYHGKGKLYDESGKLLYKGKFKNGEPE